MAVRTNTASLGGLATSRGTRFLLVGLVALVGVVAGLAVLRGANDAAPAREITIAAQGVKFDTTNPTLELAVGERVALTVVNREPAIAHDFMISGLGVRTEGYLRPGTAQTLEFTASKPGVFKYSCSLHPGLMDGKVIVR